MHNNPYIFILACLMTAVPLMYAADNSEVKYNVESYYDNLEALEKEWHSTHEASYFRKAKNLLTEANTFVRERNAIFYRFQLDLASAVLLKSRDGTEFGRNAHGAVRLNQAAIIDVLATVDVRQMKSLAAWPDLRAAYASLLMVQRAIWVSLRDPTLDGAKIVLDSTVSLQPDADAAERLNRVDRNTRVAVQNDLKSFMAETAPYIDRFLIDAFSMEPKDSRMLNEMLLMGLYTPEDRAKLMGKVEGMVGHSIVTKDKFFMLQSTELLRRLEAFDAIEGKRKQRIQELIEIVKSHDESWADPSSARGLACRMLGEMRAPESTDALLSILHVEGKNSDSAHSPAYDALVRIGVPAKAKLIEHICTSENGRSGQLAASCLSAIYGAQYAGDILRDCLGTEKDEKRRNRLSEAIALVSESKGP